MAVKVCDLGHEHKACDRCDAPIHGPWSSAGPPPDHWDYGTTLYPTWAASAADMVLLCRACYREFHDAALQAFVRGGNG